MIGYNGIRGRLFVVFDALVPELCSMRETQKHERERLSELMVLTPEPGKMPDRI